MSNTFQCGDNSALVAYMYDECEPGERDVIASHVALCVACAAELAALESTRVQLTAWAPPETDLGFVLTRPAAVTPEVATEAIQPRASWFARPMPAWAQVAAAVAIFGTGLSLGVMRGTGSIPAAPGAAVAVPPGQAPPGQAAPGQAAPGQAAPGQAAPGQPAAAVSASELTALEQRLRREIALARTMTASASAAAPASAPLSASDSQVLARVRTLIEESEQRQQRELALRTADIMRDFDSQRGVDLAQIQRSFGQMEGVTSAEVREQRQLLNYLMRVSQGQ